MDERVYSRTARAIALTERRADLCEEIDGVHVARVHEPGRAVSPRQLGYHTELDKRDPEEQT